MTNVIVRVLRTADQALLPVLKLLQDFRHPRIHPVLLVEEIEPGGPLYLLSPWEGLGSLARVAQTNPRFSFAAVARIVLQIAEALQAAHDRKLVHGHLKPENCLFTAGATLQVCDFYHGLLGDTVNHSSTSLTAPEQLQGGAQPASDQFALAALAYLLLRQRSPLAASAAARGSSVFLVPPSFSFPEPLLAPSHPLDRVLRRALSREPGERFPDIQTFARFFTTALQRLSATDTRTGPLSLTGVPLDRTGSGPGMSVPPPQTRQVQQASPLLHTGVERGGHPAAAASAPVSRQTSGLLREEAQLARRFPAQTYQPVRQGKPPSGVTPACLLPGHTAPIVALAWARDGHALVSGSEDGEIRLWTFQGTLGRPAGLLSGHRGSVRALCWSPESTLIASASSDSVLRIWDLTLPPARSLSVSHSWWGHSGDAQALAWSPDAATLVSGGKDGILRLWNRQGEMLVEQQAHGNKGIKSVTWSPDRLWVASGGADQVIHLWDVATRTQKTSWQAHLDEVHHLQWSPNGHVLASASGKKDTQVCLWDVPTGRCLATITEHRREIVGLCWAPDSSWLATCSADGLLYFWNTARLLEQHSIAAAGPPITLSNVPRLMLGFAAGGLLAVATRSLSIEILQIIGK